MREIARSRSIRSEVCAPAVPAGRAGIMLAGDGLGVAATLTIEQFLENCAEGSDGDPEESAHYQRHPRQCPEAADDLFATAFAMARAGRRMAEPTSGARALDLAAWCALNHPRDGRRIRRRISEVLRRADRVAITLVSTCAGVVVEVGIAYAIPRICKDSTLRNSAVEMH